MPVDGSRNRSQRRALLRGTSVRSLLSETSLTASRTDALLTRYVAAWCAAGGLALLGAGWVTWSQVRAGEAAVPWLALAAVVGLGVLAEWWPLKAAVRQTTLSTNLYETAVIVGLTVLPPASVALAVALGVSVSLLLQRTSAQKAAFNLAIFVVSATLAAAWVQSLNAGPVDPTTLSGIGLLILAGITFGVVNLVGMVGLLAIINDPEGRLLGDRTFYAEATYSLAVSVSLGVLLAVVLSASPWAMPLAVVPILMTRRVLAAGVHRIAWATAERNRLERTIAGASEGICLLDRNGGIELLNPAAAKLLGTDPTRAVGISLHTLLPAPEGERSIRTALSVCTPEAPRQRLDLATGELTLGVEVTALFDENVRSGSVVLLIDVTDAREDESLRREFLARVSHELRTPLTAIIGFTETLRVQADQLDPERQSSYLKVIERHGQRLGRLVDDLLWSVRFEAGKVQVAPEQVELVQLLTHVELGLRPTLQGATFEWEVEDVSVWADPNHLEQVLINLVTNAVIYGAPPVRINAWLEQDRAVIDVVDAGPGVRASFVPEMFSPFGQASVGDRREARGLGLGLAIVSSLLEQNNGTVAYHRVEDTTIFRVSLPTAVPDAALMAAPTDVAGPTRSS